MTAVEYRLARHLPPAGQGRETAVFLEVRLVGRALFVVWCHECNSHTAPATWPEANRMGVAHRSAHARVLAGEELVVQPRRPALAA